MPGKEMDFERLTVYIDSLYDGNTEILDAIEQEAIRDQVPVIRKSTQSLLRLILEMKKPETVLEIGTAVGFSAVFFCTWSEAAVTTIEQYQKRIPLAEQNFIRAGVEDRITFQIGRASCRERV